jgi:hypothetical protein
MQLFPQEVTPMFNLIVLCYEHVSHIRFSIELLQAKKIMILLNQI